MKSKISLILIILFNILLCSCGLDTFYSLEPPVRVRNTPYYNTPDHTKKYFHFYTNDALNKTLTGFDYRGTAVYYKIYKNNDLIENRSEYISSLNDSTNYLSAMEQLISYGYQPLYIREEGEQDPLVQVDNVLDSQEVLIRLTNYGEESDFNARIMINGVNIGIPSRIVGDYNGYYSFDFGRSSEGDLNKIPSSGDIDFEDGSFSEDDGIYFVDMYAVAVGQDTTFTKYYSKVLHLGVIPIDCNSENN